MKKPKRPTDIFERAKLIGDLAVGAVIEEKYIPSDEESFESLRGRKGGVQRAKNLSPEERQRQARKAARAKWKWE